MSLGSKIKAISNTKQGWQEQQKIKDAQAQIDLANELAQQAQTKTEKSNLSTSLTEQGGEKADNEVGSKGSVLSRLRAIKTIIGTPNSDMGTGDENLGTSFFRKYFFS